jgi:uncharacterized membrane protein
MTVSPSRQPRLDALRGAAMVWMTAYHGCFDLHQFHLLDANFYADPFWIAQRSCIVSLFLLCAGLAQALGEPAWPRFWRRWSQIVGCALLVTLGSIWMFPRSFISFGVLHGMALMLLLLRVTRPAPLACLVLGGLAVLAPQFIQHPFFDSRWTDWVGLVTHKPTTEDYVPLAPWFGMMLWGYGLGRWRPGILAGALPRWLNPLAFLGRWSLSYYMLHQPVMIGLLTLTMHA